MIIRRLVAHADYHRPGKISLVTAPLAGPEEHEQVLKLHEEQLSIERRVSDTGRVQVSITTASEARIVDEMLTRTDVVVDRVPVGVFVETAPSVRQEGDTLVIPVLEEVVVTRLRLVEELRVTRVATQHRHQETVTLRRETASVSRSSKQAGPDANIPEGSIEDGQ